jgi:parallel beta-helix repeat protein
MKIALRFFTLLLSTFILQPSSFGQGSLTPPPGTPAPTMKTLDQVRSTGIAINDTNTPGDLNYHFVISAPGSYYLTGNLGVTKPSGIHVTVAGVTVDLNGFQISRSTGSGGDGLTNDNTAHRCTIKNGSVSGFSNGINAAAFSGSVLQISVSGCTNRGISTGVGWEISGCKAHDNPGGANSTAIFAGNGSTLTNCTATNNQGSIGINAGQGCSLTNCTAYLNTVTDAILVGAGSSLTDCTARANTSTSGSNSAGIFASDGCTLTHCAATANTATIASISTGIVATFGCTITACTAQFNTSTNATPTGSTGAGISAGSNAKVQNCSVSFNKGDGISVSADSSVIDNVSVTNGNNGDGAGVHVTSVNNRIEGNNVANNDRGIDVGSAGNLIIKNSAKSNPQSGTSANYVIAIGNSVGPIQLAGTNAAAISGPAASTASTLGNTDPWANFSY